MGYKQLTDEKVYYCEVDHYLYMIKETKEDIQGFALMEDGSLKEVEADRAIAVGIVVSEEDFMEEKEELLKEHRARERERRKHKLMRKHTRADGSPKGKRLNPRKHNSF